MSHHPGEFVPDLVTKQDLVIEIARSLGHEPPRMSTGSTEPRTIFVMVNEHLGLGLDSSLGKPAMARGIVEAAGRRWHPDYESRGATVTRRGLAEVLEAVRYFLA